jgi:hypothetical protein
MEGMGKLNLELKCKNVYKIQLPQALMRRLYVSSSSVLRSLTLLLVEPHLLILLQLHNPPTVLPRLLAVDPWALIAIQWHVVPCSRYQQA